MLRPAGWLYGQIIQLRNHLYDKGIFKSHSLGAKTISIGNLTTGGTGKTPLVAYVAEILAHAGEKVCILTRGYGRESSGRVLVSDGEKLLVDARVGGDEPVELGRKLIGKAIVVADADRVAAAAWAKEKFDVTSFVLDDGFQHRRAKRDLDIVCIDATDPFGNSEILPAGRLREAVANLERADAIVITRTEQVNDVDALRYMLAALNPEAPVFRTQSRLVGENETLPAFAFCALGNPDNFFDFLRFNNFDLQGERRFPDHHVYTEADVRALEAEARRANADMLLTTAKDMVKLDRFGSELPLRVVEITQEIDDDEAFRAMILAPTT